ncbi:putative mechanosensitive ion channel MscS [Rosa chinensis]|uniref:Mechanosensitive ion channel protein n=1 Tax=Rosa chinensis TaxID=74649 RepID=A0A2P6Q1G5_ROSCH|nr:mechanosensitive ion channel protein 10 isoform X2 [Rosa chinensis]PRQ28023.1 putative mechanosensitive ion channel MscS [Rosa chinensis]
MKAAEKASKGGEISMSEKQSANGGEVIVELQNVGTYEGKGSPSTKQSKVNLGVTTESSSTRFGGFPSLDVSRASPNPGKPPRPPARNESTNRRKSFNRSVISKPKSRFGEPSPVLNEDGSSDHVGSPYRGASFSRASPNNISGARAISISSNRNASPGRTKDKEDEEIYKKVKLSRDKHGKMNKILLAELFVFLCILGCLVASLTVEKLENYMVWGLEIWKWCVLVMVIFSGMLVTNWVMHLIVFLIECNFLLRKKVLYFVHGMKKSVQVFLWLSLVLLTWLLLFNRGVKRSKTTTKILNYVTWTIVSLLIGAFLWLLKTLLLKILASSFHVNTFFDRIQESIFHQYVLQTLSGHPLMEEADRNGGKSPSTSKLSYRATKKAKAGKEKEVIDMTKLQQIKQEKVSSWTMKVLVDAVTSSGLSTISHTLDEMEGLNEQRDKEITSEMEATAAAYDIFLNVAPLGANYIEEWDLLRFMIEEEVELVWPLIDVNKTGQVDRKTLTEWVVKVYNGRKALAHSLTDTKTAVKQLNKLVTSVLVIITIIVWLLLMEIATTKVLVFLSSQLVVAAFMFGNTCKTIFEAIIFVFVMHPFDVGDRCVIDGVQLMVEEMNILTTVFLKLNQEKVYYPNSVLSTKPISNYYRSSNMGDNVEFSIAFTTPVKKIGELREKVKEYVEGNPTLWHPNHQIVVLEIENVNKLKLALYFSHTMNFQEWGEKQKRRSEMVMALKKCLEDLHITYYLLPLEVRLTETK